MEIKIEIIDRVYNEIEDMCNFNGITIEDYVLKAVMDNYYIMKYGDLNTKFKKNDEEKMKNETSDEVPKKKVGRPKKTETINEKHSEFIEKPVEEKVEKQDEINKVSDLTTKIKRTRKLTVK